MGTEERSGSLRHPHCQEGPSLDGRRLGAETKAEQQGGPGAGWQLTALGALDRVWEAGAQSWAVRHGNPPPGTCAVTRGVFIVVLRLQEREQWAKHVLAVIEQ